MILPFPFDLDDRVTAAAVTALGTVIGALVQLRLAWRREVSERARGVPVTKKNRRGPVLAVFLLLVAAAVGGFALSQYLVDRSEREAAAVRGEMRTQLAQISATAARLEQATLSDHGRAVTADDDRAAGVEQVTATTTVGPCRARAANGSDMAPTCYEQEAVRVLLCESVPLSAAVTATLLYAHPDDATQAWTDSRVEPGQDLGRARFADKPFERAESDQTKQVCASFATWDGERTYSARLVVKYAPLLAAHEIAPTAQQAAPAAPQTAPATQQIAPAAQQASPAAHPNPAAAHEVSQAVVAPISVAGH
ncbi:MAG TPA: hypothetical protein VMQ45_15255 [Burkholderiaceae bacterium]|nr:hypothetical protein [Burkholderiaceae bacterium]